MWIGLAALLLGTFSGSTIVPIVTKMGVSHASPIFFVFFRFFFATLLFMPFYLLTKKDKISRSDYKNFLLLAFFLFLNVSLFTIGIQFTTVIMSQILYTATPIVVGILGHFFLHEKLTKENILGLMVSLCGVGFLIYQSAVKQAVLTFGTPFGNGIILVAMLGYSGWILYGRALANKKKYTSYQVTFFTFLFIGLYLIPFLPFEKYFSNSYSGISPAGLLYAVIVALGSIILYFFIQLGIKRTNAFIASLFQYISPLIAGIFAIPLLHEKPTGSLVFGGILIILGVFYAATYNKIKKYLTIKL